MNPTLRSVRLGLRMSQDELARAVREAGDRIGEPNAANKRLVQKWEGGQIANPRAPLARALEYVTGMPIEQLGFSMPNQPDKEGGGGSTRRDVVKVGGMAAAAGFLPMPSERATRGPLSGIWHSRYEYPSSSRGGTFVGEHYVVVIQHANRIQVRSVDGSADSQLSMDLSVDGQVVTGTWSERTSATGYYGGAVYHGAIQMIVDPTWHRMAGKWVGFGRDGEMNTGPWSLTLKSASLSTATMGEYAKPPTPADE